MTRQIFLKLTAIRDEFLTSPSLSHVAGIFVPWAGPRIRTEGGLYYVGIATDGGFGADESQTFKDCFRRTAELCNGHRHDRSGTPFWQFLDRLSKALLGGPYEATTASWGWSNLLKIGLSKGTPSQWPEDFTNRQRAVCIASLKREFASLSDTIIFIASGNTYGILEKAQGTAHVWSKVDEDAGVYWREDEQSRNLYVHGYHPRSARTQRIFEKQLNKVVELAHRHRRKFGKP